MSVNSKIVRWQLVLAAVGAALTAAAAVFVKAALEKPKEVEENND